MPSSHLILCHPLLFLPSIFPSIRVFSNVTVLCIRYPKHWSFSFSISPSNEHPGLISFRWTGWISLQSKALKSLFQHHSSKASILWRYAFFIVQLSSIHDHWKNHTLTRRTSVDKVMSLLFNMLYRFVITFLPRRECLLISWLQSLSEVILEPTKIKSVTVSTVSPSICHEVWDQMPWSSFIECWVLNQVFTLLFHLHHEALHFLLGFCHNGGTICISEGIDISPCNLDSSLCFIQPGISHVVLYI